MTILRALLQILLSIGEISANSAEPAVRTTVCELWSKPEKFVGQLVAFHAFVESDGEHLALLLDTSCKRGLRFGLKSAQPRASAEAIQEAVWGGDAGTLGKSVQADFTATLKPTDQPGMFPEPLPYFLDVSEIREIQIKEVKVSE